MKKNYLMAVCLFLTVMSGCGNKEQAPQQAEPVKVKVMTVVSSVRNETVRFSGTVQEENGSSLSFPLMGRVKSVKVDLGYVSGGKGCFEAGGRCLPTYEGIA